MSSYHHGDLRRQLLRIAGEMAAESGVEAVTLRELARKAGVSHSAPVHHFKSRRNLLTALAVEGFTSLNEALEPHAADIREMGVAYVLWALDHPGHYAVMWQPHHLVADDERLNEARERAWSLMSRAATFEVSQEPRPSALTTDGMSPPAPTEVATGARINAYAAFSLVHGLVGLWLSGALPQPEDPRPTARDVTRRLVFR